MDIIWISKNRNTKNTKKIWCFHQSPFYCILDLRSMNNTVAIINEIIIINSKEGSIIILDDFAYILDGTYREPVNINDIQTTHKWDISSFLYN